MLQGLKRIIGSGGGFMAILEGNVLRLTSILIIGWVSSALCQVRVSQRWVSASIDLVIGMLYDASAVGGQMICSVQILKTIIFGEQSRSFKRYFQVLRERTVKRQELGINVILHLHSCLYCQRHHWLGMIRVPDWSPWPVRDWLMSERIISRWCTQKH